MRLVGDGEIGWISGARCHDSDPHDAIIIIISGHGDSTGSKMPPRGYQVHPMMMT